MIILAVYQLLRPKKILFTKFAGHEGPDDRLAYSLVCCGLLVRLLTGGGQCLCFG
jgi:hypothetical protein